MSPALLGSKVALSKRGLETESGDPRWLAIEASPFADHQRITSCLPASKNWNASKADASTMDLEGYKAWFLESPQVHSASARSPQREAESTHDLILAVQREADSRRIREASSLRREISQLKRQLTELHQNDPLLDLGDVTTVYGIDIPTRLSEVIQAIEESRRLLDLEDNWDENGALRFSEATWARAARFLAEVAIALAASFGVITENAEILPGSNGGLDLEICPAGRQLLITIPADPSKEVRFYGDDGSGGRQIKGSAPGSTPPAWLLSWMAE